jgi:hypothetical protein
MRDLISAGIKLGVVREMSLVCGRLSTDVTNISVTPAYPWLLSTKIIEVPVSTGLIFGSAVKLERSLIEAVLAENTSESV